MFMPKFRGWMRNSGAEKISRGESPRMMEFYLYMFNIVASSLATQGFGALGR